MTKPKAKATRKAAAKRTKTKPATKPLFPDAECDRLLEERETGPCPFCGRPREPKS